MNNSSAIYKNDSQHELPIIQQGEQILVDARLLHNQLESKRQFADWIKSRIDDYGFEDNIDYFASQKNEAVEIKRLGGHNKKDYHLTLDMAKELAMLERNEIGKAIRKYFIEAEKRSRTSVLPVETEGVFKGLLPVQYQGYKCYPYVEVLRVVGFSTRSGSVYKRKQKFFGQFFKLFGRNFITLEFAQHLADEFQVYKRRISLQVEIPFQGLMS